MKHTEQLERLIEEMVIPLGCEFGHYHPGRPRVVWHPDRDEVLAIVTAPGNWIGSCIVRVTGEQLHGDQTQWGRIVSDQLRAACRGWAAGMRALADRLDDA